MVEETYGIFRQFGDINQCFRVGMAVDERVGKEVRTFFGVEDVHGTEMLVFRTDADYFFGYLDGIAVFGVQSGDESVGLAGFHHHHTEVVALEHLVVGFFVGNAFAGTLFGKDTCITLAAFRFVRMAQVYDFDAFEAEVEFFRQFLDCFVIT